MRETRFIRVLGAAAVVFTLATTGARVAQADAQADLDTAATAYAELDYDKAYRLADSVAKQRGLSHEQLVRAYRILGRASAVLGKEQQAAEAFKLLLEYEPDEKSDSSQAPKIQDAFSTARGFWAGFTVRPGLEVQAAVHAREAGALRVTTRDPLHVVKKVKVGYRWGASGPFTTGVVSAGEGASVDVPAPPPSTSRFDYYATALDDWDDAVFEVGSAGLPKTQVVDVPPLGGGTSGEGGGGGHSIFASPWFWVVTIAVLGGGGAAVAVAASSKKTEPATAVTLSPTLFCGTVKCQ